MKITTKKYYIRPLKREDGYLLKEWGSYEDPIFYGYEYNDLTEKEITIWHKMKTRAYGSEYFSIISNDGKLLGYFGMKEINSNLRTSKFGIVLDPNLVSKGLGTEIMKSFIEYFYFEKNMRRLDLEVNSWNERAIRLYKKFGFTIVSEGLISFENQDLDYERYNGDEEHFSLKNGELFSKVYTMSLEKGDVLNACRN